MILSIVITIIISRIYCEWCWKDVATGLKAYEDVDKFFMAMYYMNYGFALAFSSISCLTFASVLSFYQMVIFKKRALNLNGRVA